jgi:hypothetical protein
MDFRGGRPLDIAEIWDKWRPRRVACSRCAGSILALGTGDGVTHASTYSSLPATPESRCCGFPDEGPNAQNRLSSRRLMPAPSRRVTADSCERRNLENEASAPGGDPAPTDR